MPAIISKCTCDSYMGNPNGAKYQDEKYGQGNRVMSQLRTDKSTTPKYRCTVCEQERSIGSAPGEKGKKK